MPDSSSRLFDDSKTWNKKSCPLVRYSSMIFCKSMNIEWILIIFKQRSQVDVITFEHATHWVKRSVAGWMFSKLLSEPRMECGIMPSKPSGIDSTWTCTSWLLSEMYAGHIDLCGCWIIEINNSTASPPAMFETAGRVTVHCWSKVRSFIDYSHDKKKNKIKEMNIQ